MVFESLVASTSALRTTSARLNQTAQNVANVSTPGYIAQRLDVGDMAGGGVQVTGQTALSGGTIASSSGYLDMAIDGQGFFVLDDGQGGQVYTRAGNFSVNALGQIVNASGLVLDFDLQVPAEATSIQVTSSGMIQALDSQGQVLVEAQLQTATFANVGGLEALGDNLYQATAASGDAMLAIPGTEGHGAIATGYLATSGTDLVTEMINLINFENTFTANLRVIQTWDDTVGNILDIVG